MSRPHRQWLHWTVAGMVVGAAEVVPGFSGGTAAVLVRIYERLLNAVAGLRPSVLRRGWQAQGVSGLWRAVDGTFVCVFTLVLLLSVWLLSHPISWLYEHYRAQFLVFLLVLVGGNLPPLLLQLRPTRLHFAAVAAGAVCVFALFQLPYTAPSSPDWPVWLLAGAGAGMLMILPGVSGSYLLLTLGLYAPALSAIRGIEPAVLLPLAAGALTGAACGARVLTALLRLGGDGVRAFFYGMVAGSLPLLWPGGAAFDLKGLLAAVAAGICVFGLLRLGRAAALSSAVLLALTAAPAAFGQSDSGAGERELWPTYQVSKGENLSMIAALYSVQSSHLVRWNGLSSPNRIFPGKKLRMPPGTRARTHRVKKGETLGEIALSNRTFLKRLEQLNGLASPDLIYPGQVLRLGPQLQVSEHRVRAGDTLLKLALRYNRSVQELAGFNRLQPPYPIRPGQRIRLTAPAPAGENTSAAGAAGVASGAERRQQRQADQSVRWQWPSNGALQARFHPTQYKGVDIVAAEGSLVRAAADGEVRYAGDGLFRDYGWLVIVSHGRYLSVYAHNREVLVRTGERIRRGQPVARMGSSGTSLVKLHFQIKYQGRPTDPLSLLPKRQQDRL